MSRSPSGGVFPDPPPCRTSPHDWVHQLAIASLLLFALTALAMNRDLVRVLELLTVLALVASLPWVVRIRPNFVFCALFVALIGWMLWVDYAVSVAPEDLNVARFERVYARQFLFLVAGWWVAASLANARVLLVAGIAGCLAALIAASTTGDWGRALTGGRENFGFHNAQHTALYFGSVLLALPALATPVWRCRQRYLRMTGLAGLMGIAVLSVLILGAAQTRQTWGALIPALITALAVLYLVYGMRPRLPRRTVAAAVVAIMAVLVLANPWQGAWERTVREIDEVASLIDPNEDAEASSTTVRLVQWGFALGAIAERPLAGHGGGMTGRLLQQSDVPGFARDRFGHVHNGYLEMAVQYGVVGLGLWLAAMATLLRQILVAIRAGRLDPGFAVFALAWPVYFLVLNLFESFTRYDSSTYVMFVFAGAIYGATLYIPTRVGSSQKS